MKLARQRKRKGDPVHGWLVLNKPVDMTSTQAVAKMKRLFDAQKAGHGGTLDPLADGILPIAFGEATKTTAYAMAAEKSYSFEIEWGTSTSTLDKEGEVTGRSDKRVDVSEVRNALAGFVGEIEQIPPQYSAIKVNGERAYDLARDGEEVELQPRQVQLFSAELDEASTSDKALIHVNCGKGFYIRALARDLAEKLGLQGHVSRLQRTRVGRFSLENAVNVDQLDAMDGPEARRAALVSIDLALENVPKVEVPSSELGKLQNGNDVLLMPHVTSGFRAYLNQREGDDRTALAMHDGKPLALGEVRAGYFKPTRVLQIK